MQISKLRYLLLVTVFLLPLLQAHKSYGYEHIKILFFMFSISLIGLFWLGKGFKWTLISKLAGLFLLGLLVASLTGIDPKSSLLGNQPYFQGVIFYSYLYLFYLMVKTFKIEIIRYAAVLSTSALIVSLLAIGQWVQLNLLEKQIPAYAGRVVSSFGQPNFYAGFLLLTLPFCYLIFKSHNKRLQILGWASGFISILGILVSYSRSAILLMLLLLVLGLIEQLRMKLKLVILSFVIILVSSFIALKYSSGFLGDEFTRPLSTNNPDLKKESVENRVYIWPQAVKIALDKPYFGFGLENINLAFSNYFQKNKHSIFEENLNINPILISLKDLNIDRTHNYILDLFLFSGTCGVLAWLILIIFVLIKLFKSNRENRGVLIISLLTYLVWIQFQNQSIVQLVYFWTLAGLIDLTDS